MSSLEDLVRHSLASQVQRAPSARGLAAGLARARRRRQRMVTALGALAVTGISLGATLVISKPSPTALQHVVPAPPAVAAGMRAIGFRGVEMLVPLDFQEGLGCGRVMRSSYSVGNRAHVMCLVQQPALLTYVTMSTTAPPFSDAPEETTVDGAPAHRGTLPGTHGSSPTDVLVLDRQQLRITVQAPEAATRERLLATVRVLEGTDRNGCPIRVPDLDPASTARTAEALVQQGAESITVCSYADLWIRDSRSRTGADAAALARRLNALRAGVSRHPGGADPSSASCREEGEMGLVLRIRYPSGVKTAVAHLGSCGDIYVGDGRGTRALDFGTTIALLDDLDYDGGFPGPGVLVPG